jgi:hypothetical protein
LISGYPIVLCSRPRESLSIGTSRSIDQFHSPHRSVLRAFASIAIFRSRFLFPCIFSCMTRLPLVPSSPLRHRPCSYSAFVVVSPPSSYPSYQVPLSFAFPFPFSLTDYLDTAYLGDSSVSFIYCVLDSLESIDSDPPVQFQSEFSSSPVRSPVLKSSSRLLCVFSLAPTKSLPQLLYDFAVILYRNSQQPRFLSPSALSRISRFTLVVAVFPGDSPDIFGHL